MIPTRKAHEDPTAISVIIVHGDERQRAQIRQAFEAVDGVQVLGERGDLRAGMAMAHQVRPAILVLELAGAGDDVFHAASQYRLHHPDGVLFLAAEAPSPETLMRAMRVGVQEVLVRPLDRSALVAAVERVAQVSARRSGHAAARSVFTVFANKGGVGTTTLSTNLATGLRRVTQREVAIVDFEHQAGVVAAFLGVTPRRSLADVLAAERIDSTSVQDAMVRHASGLAVLAQPERLDEAGAVTALQAAAILDVVTATYDYVVVDAPHDFNDVTMEIFDRSTSILLITDLSFASVRAARRALDVFQRLNYLAVPDRVRLIVNRRVEKSAISAAQVEQTLGVPIAHSVANDYAAVSEAIHVGRPLCGEEPAGKVGRDLDALVRELVPADGTVLSAAAPAEKRGRLRLFGKGNPR